MTPDELRALADAATPGPWHRVSLPTQTQVRGMNDARVSTRSYSADARLIALAPDLARLCAELGEALDDISRTSASSSEGMCQNMARAATAKLSELEAR